MYHTHLVRAGRDPKSPFWIYPAPVKKREAYMKKHGLAVCPVNILLMEFNF